MRFLKGTYKTGVVAIILLAVFVTSLFMYDVPQN